MKAFLFTYILSNRLLTGYKETHDVVLNALLFFVGYFTLALVIATVFAIPNNSGFLETTWSIGGIILLAFLIKEYIILKLVFNSFEKLSNFIKVDSVIGNYINKDKLSKSKAIRIKSKSQLKHFYDIMFNGNIIMMECFRNHDLNLNVVLRMNNNTLMFYSFDLEYSYQKNYLSLLPLFINSIYKGNCLKSLEVFDNNILINTRLIGNYNEYFKNLETLNISLSTNKSENELLKIKKEL